ncbi:regulatory iron-sulfur-containing complex subunit RicT [Mangrovivirga sp. M17]|uniref:Regulatory iron-sulfur-containing complex subunit RicT n=1 Tax=Mangrovivirga halotolerans TaxID=2993936 RepID=A0ABT3RPA6_9BACT|nr:regulatory iron-sulfur-containing complex subunit RicT [Mangrovivirga halotolerans]MCX2743427.1 regulatory iron-sulfur-containing complex subunit RicT [Mangrovivirga halotolerans]
MACSTCATKNKDGSVSGCQNNGACGTGGCNKMNVFDWLSNMELPSDQIFNIVEVRFKNGRKEFFRNSDYLDLTTGEPIIVNVPNGHHLGHVSLQGELVRLQMKKKGVEEDSEEVRNIYRKATDKDLEKYEEVKNREMPTLYRTREIIRNLGLSMKLSEVEYQADNSKATFFYSADDRVDFRELIKVLAAEFKIRVEMKQISLRQEAGMLGGIGSCGRELCCSTWLTEFKSVSTSAARYQNLSLNPGKLSGQCGRLKCCLNYELETYMDALKDIPEMENETIETEKGKARLQKTDIFRKIMWFGFSDENTWHPVEANRVREIIELNEKGIKPATLFEDEIELNLGSSLNSDLERLDKKLSKGSKPKKKRKKRRKKPENQSQQQLAAKKKPAGNQPKSQGGGQPAKKQGSKYSRQNHPKAENKPQGASSEGQDKKPKGKPRGNNKNRRFKKGGRKNPNNNNNKQ